MSFNCIVSIDLWKTTVLGFTDTLRLRCVNGFNMTSPLFKSVLEANFTELVLLKEDESNLAIYLPTLAATRENESGIEAPKGLSWVSS